MSTPPRTALDFFNAAAGFYEKTTGGATRDLARYLVSLCPPLEADSAVLDNACGTGIVTQELLAKESESITQPVTIQLVDGAPAMVDVARQALQSGTKGIPSTVSLKFDVMSGEKLDLPDNAFTHSVTNQGILFFTDGAQGAKEIYRTLKTGGTAIVTSWGSLGYIEVVHQAQKIAKPEFPLFKVPVPDQWYDKNYLQTLLQDSGFKDVEVHEKVVHYGAETVEDVVQILTGLLAALWKDWDEKERQVMREEMLKGAENAVVKFDRPPFGDVDDRVRGMVGIPMTALVAVAKK